MMTFRQRKPSILRHKTKLRIVQLPNTIPHNCSRAAPLSGLQCEREVREEFYSLGAIRVLRYSSVAVAELASEECH
jgi:hypothetical protein